MGKEGHVKIGDIKIVTAGENFYDEKECFAKIDVFVSDDYLF